jgi:hypothetical protein
VNVSLLPELFDPPIENTLLVSLLRYPLDDRHRVQLDIGHPSVAAWLAGQSHGVREEITLALDLSTRLEALESSHTKVTVTRVAPSNYLTQPVRVCLADARRFLDAAFVILVEDQISDRAFLERILPREGRRALLQKVRAGFVRIDHGGGVGPMASRMTQDATVTENHHTMWVLFDSDAMQPGAPSLPSEALRIACGAVAHHQLRRRYAESYLPHRALHGWAAGTPRRTAREARLALFRAFVALKAGQRHHFNMKEGFDGDMDRTDATAGDLYADVPAVARAELASGFGRAIADLFATESVTEADLRRDASAWSELQPVLVDLLARIR